MGQQRTGLQSEGKKSIAGHFNTKSPSPDYLNLHSRNLKITFLHFDNPEW